MLPLELVLLILECIYCTPEGIIDYDSLRNCCLVCRSWRPVTQEFLFSRLVLNSARPPDTIENVTNFLGESHLGSKICVLDIAIGEPHAVSTHAFAKLLINCPNLYELSIHATAVHSLDSETMSILSKSPPFKALRIIKLGVQSILPYQLLSLGSSVRHLSLHSEWHATPPSQPINHSLYELITRRAPHRSVLLWLLSTSVSTLRLLEMWDMCDFASMRTILNVHGPHIRSLRVLYYDYQAVKLISGCLNLEELVLLTVPYTIASHELPKTITHLAFRNPVHASAPSFDTIFNAITALPKLRLLTCDKASTEHTDFPRLEAICSKRNIELTWHSLNFATTEDMLPERRYPTGKSLFNLRLMAQ